MDDEKAKIAEALDRGQQQGYWEALCDYGIWSSGVQMIGCMNTPIHECFKKRFPDGDLLKGATNEKTDS